MQELLVRAGAVLWLDPTIRLIGSENSHSLLNTNNISNYYYLNHSYHSHVNHDSSVRYEKEFTYSKLLPPKVSDVYSPHQNISTSNNGKLHINNSIHVDHNSGRGADNSLQSHILHSVLGIDSTKASVNDSSNFQPLYPMDEASLLNLQNKNVKKSGAQLKEDRPRQDAYSVFKKRKLLRDERRSVDKSKSRLNSKSQRRDIESSISKRVPRYVNEVSNSIDKSKELLRELQSEVAPSQSHTFSKYMQSNLLIENEEKSLSKNKKSALSSNYNKKAPNIENNIDDINSSHTVQTNDNDRYIMKPKYNGRMDIDNNVFTSSLKKPLSKYRDMSSISLLSSKDSDILPLLDATDDGSSTGGMLNTWKHWASANKGVVVWAITDVQIAHLPTAALTHPGMFTAMHTPKALYDFHQVRRLSLPLL